MTNYKKQQIIENMPIIGYWSCLGGVEVRHIEDTIDGTKLYIKANAWHGKPSYHILKVLHRFTQKDTVDYISLFGYHLRLDECIREYQKEA